MKVEIENLQGHFKKLSIEIPADRVSQQMNSYFRELQRNVTLKGFRKGKAPLDLVKRTYESSAVGDIVRDIVDSTLREAIKNSSLEPAGLPEIEVEGLKEGTSFKYTAKFENTPPVNLKTYSGFKSDKLSTEVTPADIDEALKNLQNQLAVLEPAVEGTTLQKGQVAHMDYQATENGVPFAPASEKDSHLEIGNGSLVADFEKNIVGLKAGDSKTFTVSFPEAKSDEEKTPVAGKTLEFNIQLKTIKVKKLPELDDALASKVGVKTFDELKGLIDKDIKNRKEQSAKRDLQEKAVTWLIENNPVDTPETMLNAQMEQLAMDAGVQLSQMGLTEVQIEERLKSWSEEMQQRAVRQVKASLLLGSIARKENIQAGDEEFRQEIMRISMQSGRNPQEVVEDLRKKNLVSGLVRQLTELKALDWVLKDVN